MHAAQAKEEAYVVFRIDAPQRPHARQLRRPALQPRAPVAHRFPALLRRRQDLDPELLAHQHGPALGRDPLRDGRVRPAGHAVGAVQVSAEQLRRRPGRVQPLRGADGGELPAGRTRLSSPIEVTFNWSERQADYSLVERSHTELVQPAAAPVHDQRRRGRPSGGEFAASAGAGDVPRRSPRLLRRQGRRRREVRAPLGDLREEPRRGKPYTVSVPSSTNGAPAIRTARSSPTASSARPTPAAPRRARPRAGTRDRSRRSPWIWGARKSAAPSASRSAPAGRGGMP